MELSIYLGTGLIIGPLMIYMANTMKRRRDMIEEMDETIHELRNNIYELKCHNYELYMKMNDMMKKEMEEKQESDMESDEDIEVLKNELYKKEDMLCFVTFLLFATFIGIGVSMWLFNLYSSPLLRR